ncbi:flagellar biosynthetic protein FliO [Asticcacaulis machinosus]|uniref:Flagellar biosynthetic protein FliO n=1 Tax=Asticcacaulis machinosus TaxID=2984211 RepID=A0ABT5HM76_9CAUL|nr:flagellar biosynthetic protein FliO [Asticcacaulis machinosus]MDC7677346.1 flagellar biosynthetic protein FliO [Asticcacaulis machinosus]
MDLVGVLRAVFALMTVLGLILGLAFVLRRYAPQLMARLTAPRGQKRMQVVETLVLDPARRLVLVRLDDEERLLLLGEGKELIEPRQFPKPKPKLPPSPEPAPAVKPALRTRPLSDKDL